MHSKKYCFMQVVKLHSTYVVGLNSNCNTFLFIYTASEHVHVYVLTSEYSCVEKHLAASSFS